MSVKLWLSSLLLFVGVFLVTLVVVMPVSFVVDRGGSFVPENIHLHSPEGSLLKGRLVVTDVSLTTTLPVEWKTCFIEFLHPLGFCLSLAIENIPVHFAVEPWSVGDITTIYRLDTHSDIASLSQLHPKAAGLALASGTISADIRQLEIDIKEKSIVSIQGDLQLQEASFPGLFFGTVNVSLNTETDDQNEAGESITIIAAEGGNIEAIQILGSGTLTADGLVNVRFLLRSNKPAIQQQLAVIAQKKSETEFEFIYSGKIF